MANYIEVQNDKNILQVNDSYENISFLKKVNIAEWEKTDLPNWEKRTNSRWRGLLSIEENPAFWFLYNNSNYEIRMTFFAGNVKGKYARKFDVMLNASSVAPTFLDFYIFGFKSELAAARQGLEIFNQNNRRIFSSEEKYLKIIETLAPKQLEENYVYNPPSGKKIAVHPTGIPMTIHFNQPMHLSLYTWKILTLGPHNSYVKAPEYTEPGFQYSGAEGVFSEIAYKSMWTIADITGL